MNFVHEYKSGHDNHITLFTNTKMDTITTLTLFTNTKSAKIKSG